MLDKVVFKSPAWSEGRLALDAGSLRQRIIAQNLAQASTPGYQPQRVSFEERLVEARSEMPMARTHSGHLAIPPQQETVPRVESRSGGTVEIERELTEMQENAIHYRAMAQFVSGRYRAVINAIGSQR